MGAEELLVDLGRLDYRRLGSRIICDVRCQAANRMPGASQLVPELAARLQIVPCLLLDKTDRQSLGGSGMAVRLRLGG